MPTTTHPGASDELVYESGGRTFVGVLVPATTTPRAVAVLLPDWRGRSGLARDHAAHLAGLGCTTLIADLYGDGLDPADPGQVAPMVQHLLEHRSEGVAALSAAVTALRGSVHEPALPLVVVGFSAGAVVALDHGRRTREATAIVVCSGLLRTAEAGTPTQIAAPVLLVQGTQDEVSPMPVLSEIVAEADRAGNDVRLLLLSQTHHAYDNPDAGTDPTARLVYSPRSAARMRQAVEGLVEEAASVDTVS